jgi:hypothetical protein
MRHAVPRDGLMRPTIRLPFDFSQDERSRTELCFAQKCLRAFPSFL